MIAQPKLPKAIVVIAVSNVQNDVLAFGNRVAIPDRVTERFDHQSDDYQYVISVGYCVSQSLVKGEF
jgi:hypothetical protein